MALRETLMWQRRVNVCYQPLIYANKCFPLNEKRQQLEKMIKFLLAVNQRALIFLVSFIIQNAPRC